jgi:hypothetical protein
MPEAKKVAKKVLSHIGKGLKAFGRSVDTAIKQDRARYQENQRRQRIQRQIDNENYRQNYIAGKAYASGFEDGRQERLQRARNERARQRNQDAFENSFFEPSRGLINNAEDFYTRDLYPPKKRNKKRTYW